MTAATDRSDDRERLARIETKLDSFIDTQRDHETRVRVLEGWRYWCIGAAAAVGAGASKVAAMIPSVLPHQ